MLLHSNIGVTRAFILQENGGARQVEFDISLGLYEGDRLNLYMMRLWRHAELRRRLAMDDERFALLLDAQRSLRPNPSTAVEQRVLALYAAWDDAPAGPAKDEARTDLLTCLFDLAPAMYEQASVATERWLSLFAPEQLKALGWKPLPPKHAMRPKAASAPAAPSR